VPSELVASFDPQRKIEIRNVPLKVYSGDTWLLGNEWVVHVSDTQSPAAKRCTLFHEAFHILCSMASGLPHVKKTDLIHRPFNELLADHFAACMLMPKGWVQEQWLKVRDIREMATHL